MSVVQYSLNNGVAEIVLNRPGSRNAIDEQLLVALRDHLALAQRDPAVSVILIAAQGEVFCVGDDIKAMDQKQITEPAVRFFVSVLQDISRQIMLQPTPVVLAAQGWIVGGASAWALNADFLLVTPSARMLLPEAAYGMYNSGGVSRLLPRAIGEQRAARYLWLGDTMNADEMQAYGLAAMVDSEAALRREARALAVRLTHLPERSRQTMKLAKIERLRSDLEQAFAFEMECCVAAALDPAVRERMLAAISKG